MRKIISALNGKYGQYGRKLMQNSKHLLSVNSYSPTLRPLI